MGPGVMYPAAPINAKFFFLISIVYLILSPSKYYSLEKIFTILAALFH